jgi:quercetin dioxygenase-like cupin family protein
MTVQMHWVSIFLTALAVFAVAPADAQLAPTCIENSPERRGAIGCSNVENKLLPEGLREPLFWHIDKFDSLDHARAAVGPASVAFDAGGTSWLMTVESQTSNHHGGSHVTHVGPLPLPRAARYSMQVISSLLTPGMYSSVHHHPGVETVYVLEGEACFETPTRAYKLQKGETLSVPPYTDMRAVILGTVPRYVLAAVIHDAAQPPTMRMEGGPEPTLAVCR